MNEREDRGFESVEEILSRGSGDSMSSSQGRTVRQEELECQTCHRNFIAEVATYTTMLGKQKELRPKGCPECTAAREEQELRESRERLRLETLKVQERWRLECGIPALMLQKTLDNFEVRSQREAFRVCQKYAQGFPMTGPLFDYPSLLLYSEVFGCGKTHLACAMANHLISAWEGDPEHATCPVRFESGPGLMRRIRATYNVRPGEWHETEEEIYHELRGVRLLFLDDVGKEKPSDNTREVYWYIIDQRCTTGLPVVITSNLPVEGKPSLVDLMGGSTVDRLVGMTKGKIIKLSGESYRQLKKQP